MATTVNIEKGKNKMNVQKQTCSKYFKSLLLCAKYIQIEYSFDIIGLNSVETIMYDGILDDNIIKDQNTFFIPSFLNCSSENR